MRWHPGSLVGSAWLAVAVFATAGALVQHFGLLAAFDRMLLDTGFRLQREWGPRVTRNDPVIVGIDEAFLDGVEEPLSLHHVYLSRFLLAMRDAQPRVIGLDLALPEKRFQSLGLAARPDLDFHKTLLGALLATSREVPVVAAKVWNSERGRFRDIQVDFATVLSMNASAGAAHASALFCQDPDGRVRHYPGPACQPGGTQSTLSSEVAAALGVPVPDSGLIDYQAGAEFTYVPMKLVLDLAARGDRLALRKMFSGRAVLLGTVLEDIDLIATPVQLAAWRPGDHRVPGVVVHAQIVRNLLDRGLIQPAPAWLLLFAPAPFALFLLGAAIVRKFAVLALVSALMLAAAIQFLAFGVWLPTGAMLLTGLVACGARSAVEGWRGGRERKRLAATFSGYVSPAVMKEILKFGTSRQEGYKATVCVLFSDIRNFTTLSECMPAEEVVALLNRYFARMTKVVHRHGGTVDKFIGDGLMAFFGAPNTMPSPARSAFDAADDMLRALADLNREFAAEGRDPLAIGVGLHLGEAVIGSVGSPERHAYTAIGDTVNTAARLEGLCKELGWPVVCSEAVAHVSGRKATLVPLGAQRIKGRSDVIVYGWRPPEQNTGEDTPGKQDVQRKEDPGGREPLRSGDTVASGG